MKTEELLQQINEMEYEGLMEVLATATRRWGSLFPDWEIITLSAPRNNMTAKKEAIQYAFAMLEKEEEENTIFVDTKVLPEKCRALVTPAVLPQK